MSQETPPIENDWISMCPYLEVTPPNPLYSHKDKIIDDLVEIRDFFRQKNPDDYMSAFVDHLSSISIVPKSGNSKVSQVLKSIRLNKLSTKILNAIDDL